jgi:hypothetical protein
LNRRVNKVWFVSALSETPLYGISSVPDVTDKPESSGLGIFSDIADTASAQFEPPHH